MNKRTYLTPIAIVSAVAVGLAGGYLLGQREQPATVAPSGTAEPEPLFYRNPMNPEITSPVPAKDEMGMDYIPVYADDSAADAPPGTVRIDPVTLQSIGVRTAAARKQNLSRQINTVGRVDYDEEHLYKLHPKTEGWIEELRVDVTGEVIRPDDILLSIYSPQLVSTQQEYLLALKNLETLEDSPFPDVSRGARELVDTSLERLRLLDVPAHQIEELRRDRQVKKLLHIHAPAGGVITHVGVREGQYVTPKDELYTIADLSRVWVLVDIYEDELPWVQVGDRADMTVMAVPGKTFSGRLTYIYPYAESQTRTIKARLEFENPDRLLKPEMFANVTVYAGARQDVVAVPSEAILRSGLGEKVFVVRDSGEFAPRDVSTGVSSEGFTEIREGIEAGERVVVSAQFLIDSESRLREAAAKMRSVDDNDREAGDDHADH